MIIKVLFASAALFGLASTTLDASAQGYGYHRRHYYGLHARRAPGQIYGLGLRKQTRTGGPSGGSTNGGGGGS